MDELFESPYYDEPKKVLHFQCKIHPIQDEKIYNWLVARIETAEARNNPSAMRWLLCQLVTAALPPDESATPPLQPNEVIVDAPMLFAELQGIRTALESGAVKAPKRTRKESAEAPPPVVDVPDDDDESLDRYIGLTESDGEQ